MGYLGRSFAILVVAVVVGFGPAGLAEDRDAQVDAWLDQLGRSGGALLIPAGQYDLHRTLEIDLKRFGKVTIAAQGPVTIRMHAAGPAIRLTGSLEGTADPQTQPPEIDPERGPRIASGIAIEGFHPEADGIELEGTMQAVIDAVQIRKVRHGIRLVKRNRNVILSNLHLYDNSGVGLFLDHVDLHQINLSASHLSYNRGGGLVVLGGNVRNLQVNGCDLEANMPADQMPTDAANLWIDCRPPGSSVAEVAVTGCTLQHSSRSGSKRVAPGGANVRIWGRADYQPNMLTLTGNLLSDTSISVDLVDVADATLTGNQFFTAEPLDLRMERCQRVIVSSSAFHPRESDDSGGIILLDCQSCLLQTLICHRLRHGEAAIQLKDCRRCQVSGCLVSQSRGGVRKEGGADVSVEGLLEYP
ncbi:MAG: right-handed parallel beta-helix repeat-containing protein [Pirellulaceae bacterium]